MKRNKEVVQKWKYLLLMLWKTDALIEYISKYFTLKIGDIIFTGTPSGVGKVFADDVLEGFLEEDKMFSIKVK